VNVQSFVFRRVEQPWWDEEAERYCDDDVDGRFGIARELFRFMLSSVLSLSCDRLQGKPHVPAREGVYFLDGQAECMGQGLDRGFVFLQSAFHAIYVLSRMIKEEYKLSVMVFIPRPVGFDRRVTT